jgi:hypothetical protein
MKIKLGLLAILAVALAGCGHATRSSGSYLGEITRHPDRYTGSTISVFGTVVSVDKTDEGTKFRIATVNYAYVFDVTYPGDIPKLVHDKDAYFLGKVVGGEKSTEAYSGVIVKVNAIAVRAVGAKAVFQPQDRRLAQEWVKGDLELAEVQTRGGSAESEEAASPSAAPMGAAGPSYASTYAPRASNRAYPGLDGLADPIQLPAGYQPAAPQAAAAPVQISSEPMPPPPPPMPAAAPIALAPPPAPVEPAPAPVAVASTPVPLDQADAADLRLVNRNWANLPDDVKAKIVRDIEQRTQFSDLTMISQNWHNLPEDVKAAILKQIIESAR